MTELVREVVLRHYLDLKDIPHTTSSLAYRASMHHLLVEILKEDASYGATAAAILAKFTLTLPR